LGSTGSGKRLVYALHAPTCKGSQRELVLQMSSSGVVTPPSLVAMEKSEGGHLGGATCFFIEVCGGSILFCFFLLPSLLFLKNNKGYCHFNFMSNLFLIHLIIIYFLCTFLNVFFSISY
jgi:hypothetical protein